MMANAVENVQSSRERYRQTYQETQRKYPAEIFPKREYRDGESFQSTQSLTAILVAVQGN
jgi:hypothetical protein